MKLASTATLLAIQAVWIAPRAIGPVKRRPNRATNTASRKAITVVSSRVAPRMNATNPETRRARATATSKALMRSVPALVANAVDGVAKARDRGHALAAPLWADGSRKAQFRRFLQSGLHSRHGTHVSGERDLAEHDAFLGQGRL